MKYLIFGDVHGNIIALEKLKKHFFNKVDIIICHGDVVNYGPWSNECVDLLSSEDIICLKGNHEDAYLKGFYPGKNNLVKQFFSTTFKSFEKIDIIKSYGVEYENDLIKVVHTVNNKYYYPDSDLENFSIKKNLIIGHSHYPFIRKINEHNFVNTGSVGQNRKDISLINSIIYDSKKNNFELIEIKYDAKKIINEMEVRSYPIDCINYYKEKLK
tara:strand:- start:450 stop:1091 length:642 start_codon:yes stop_codon:yes gene_type:complete